MVVKLEYPIGKSRQIRFEPYKTDYLFESLRNERWYKCTVVSKELGKFNRVNKKLLIESLYEMLKYKHHASKCEVVEELICQLKQ